jgi:hypothetical protein
MFMGPPIKDSPTIDGPVSVLPRVSRNSIQVEIDPRKQLRGPHIYYVRSAHQSILSRIYPPRALVAEVRTNQQRP